MEESRAVRRETGGARPKVAAHAPVKNVGVILLSHGMAPHG
jgi:hypothetical protein